MKLQAASKKELLRVAVGTAIGLILMLAGFYILSLLSAVTFDYRVILGGLGGSVVAVINFAALCLTIQKAAQTQENGRKSNLQLSYHIRLLLQAGWVVAASMLPWFHAVAAALPLLFPTAVIFLTRRR